MTTPTTTALPQEIVALVATVVKRTKLRKRERTDIERELAAHFRDGLDAGKDASTLIDAFGDPRESALQLRAGAIAKRTPFDRALRRLLVTALWATWAFIGLYGIGIAYLWVNKPVISFNPMIRLHESLPKVTEAERAWPIYKQALILLADPSSRAGQSEKPFTGLTFNDYGVEGTLSMVGDANWERQCKMIAQRDAGLELLSVASKKPALGYMPHYQPKVEDAEIFPYDESIASKTPPEFPMFAVQLPQLDHFRSAARLLASDSLHALEQDDGARFVRDISAMIAMSMHTSEDQTLISQLVASAMRTIACERIVMAIEWKPQSLKDEQLVLLASRLRSIPDAAFQVELSIELLMLQDMLQRTYSDDGHGDGYFNAAYGAHLISSLESMSSIESNDFGPSAKTMGVLLSPIGAALMATRKETIDMCEALYDKSERQSKLPLWQQDFGYEQEFSQLVTQDAVRKWLIPRLLMPVVGRAVAVCRRAEGHSIAAQTAIALEQFRRAHAGSWPTAINELVPTYLGSAPADPYTGKPIGYTLADGHPLVWSIGDKKFDEFGNIVQSRSERVDWIWFKGDDGLKRWNPKPSE